MGILGRLLGFFFRAFFRIVFSVLLFAIISAGLTLLIASVASHTWPPTTLTVVACVVIGVLAAYAAGLTVLLGEAVTAIHDAAKDAVREVESKA